MSENKTWSMRMAEYYAEGGSDEEPHPVCVVHLAWIPCRHGRPDSPCEWRNDETSQTVVGRFHAGELSRWEALDLLKELEGS